MFGMLRIQITKHFHSAFMYHTRLLLDSLLLQTADALAPEHADASAADVLATLRFHGIAA
jgi:hypothetical protein